jgi:hypothetical protein
MSNQDVFAMRDKMFTDHLREVRGLEDRLKNIETEYASLHFLARQAVDCWQDPVTAKIDLEKRMVELRKHLDGE